MLEDIIKKIKKDELCNLTVEELKILYEIDSNIDMSEYRNKRDKVVDLIKIFGRERVALEINEINYNTICLIGSIDCKDLFYRDIPLYNLRYIYGDISNYNYTNPISKKFEPKLDNLEKVFGRIDARAFYTIPSYFSNIEKVKELTLFNLDGIDEELPYDIEILEHHSLKYPNLTLPPDLKHLCLNEAKVDIGGNIVFNDKLKSAIFPRITYIKNLLLTDLLPDNLELLSLDAAEYIKNNEQAIFPSNLKRLELTNLINGYGLKLPTSLIKLNLSSINVKEQLPKLDHLINLEELNISSINNLEGVKLPPNLKVLHVQNLNKIDYPKSLEKLYVSIRTKNIIEKDIPEGIKFFSAGTIKGMVFPKSLEELELRNQVNNGVLNDYTFENLKKITMVNIIKLNKVIFPKEMELLYLRDTTKMTNCTLPDYCESLKMLDLKRTDSLILPRVLGVGVFNKLKYVKKLIFPEQVSKYITMSSLIDLNNQKIPRSLSGKVILQRSITDDMLTNDEEYYKKVKKYRR